MAVEITGMNELLNNLKGFVYDVDQAVSESVKVTAFKVQKNAISLIKEPSVGTYVTRYTAQGEPYSHVASKSGDAPNTDTGRLVGDINVDFSKGDLFAYVFTNVPYGFFLETVMNRPFLQPALIEGKKDFSQVLKRSLEKQIEKAGK